ncbi:DUF1365 domain-containing protein [Psychrobacter sp. FBL11]|uniref:DUF1365 domain-containing protein n=1 Tax=Psychrobacter saeujeotis TaxID=3143436 RepID=A0ABU9X4X1_9GAMM|nr:DUF1365 domain-containing protein [uncultured Psychrobacter sp.]
MIISAYPSDATSTHQLPHTADRLPHQLFHGSTWHSRLLPSMHKFAYPYRYWGVNITALAAGEVLPEISVSSAVKPISNKRSRIESLSLFSAQRKALQQFCAEDYLSSSVENSDVDSDDRTGLVSANALEQRLKTSFIEHTGSAPAGEIIGMLVCRNVGLYFSPVNFYLGFDKAQTPTHLLAEVSNTPWDKRHYYGVLLEGTDTEFCHDKNFHVSPFNPIDQQYCWQVKIKKQADNCLQVRIAINISDARGDVLKTGVKMSGIPMTKQTIRDSLRQNPFMNFTSLTRIYWHAFKLYAIKKVPYVNYDEKLADSQQQQDYK